MQNYDLEERLIVFGLLVSEIVELIPGTRLGNHISGQLIRSGTSPSFNYGEAQVAESRSDFIHKMKICLKELKESNVALQYVIRKPLIPEIAIAVRCREECLELIKIFVSSINTACNRRK